MKSRFQNFKAFTLSLTFAAAVMFIASNAQLIAQAFTLPAGATYTNMLVSAGNPPVGTGCTITAGSTDGRGSCLTTATSGSIAFGRTYSTAPECVIVDRTATPVAVYSVSTTAITLTTVTSAHNLSWYCGTAGY